MTGRDDLDRLALCSAGRTILRDDRWGGLVWNQPCPSLGRYAIELNLPIILCGPHFDVAADDLDDVLRGNP